MAPRSSPLLVAASAAAFAALVLPGAALAHGDRVAISELASRWQAEPVVLALSALALVLFAQAFARLRRRRRSEHTDASRPLLFVLGVALAALALVSPLEAVGEEYLLSGHMLQHVVIGDIAPALVTVALRGPLVFFLLPRPALRAAARLVPLRVVLRVLVRPKVSVGVWAIVLAAWHVPAAYEHALGHPAVHELEHALFVLAGVLVWAQLVDPAGRRKLRVSGRLAVAFVLFAAGQALSQVLVFSFDPLYPTYAAQDERLLGLSPLTDQRLAGVVMMVEQLVTLGTCAVFLLRAQARDEQERASLSAPGPSG